MKQETDFYKSSDFMRLGQDINHKQWQSAAMIIRRLDIQAKESGIKEFERNFTSLRQCISRKEDREAKQILALISNRRAAYLNKQSLNGEGMDNASSDKESD